MNMFFRKIKARSYIEGARFNHCNADAFALLRRN